MCEIQTLSRNIHVGDMLYAFLLVIKSLARNWPVFNFDSFEMHEIAHGANSTLETPISFARRPLRSRIPMVWLFVRHWCNQASLPNTSQRNWWFQSNCPFAAQVTEIRRRWMKKKEETRTESVICQRGNLKPKKLHNANLFYEIEEHAFFSQLIMNPTHTHTRSRLMWNLCCR